MISETRSLGADRLTSPRLRIPTIRLPLLITGNRRTFSSSMCRTALARSSSSRQQMDTWGHHLARRCAAGIKAVLRQALADDVAVGHHADKLVVLPDRNGAYVMLTHQFRELGDRGVRTDPVDAFVHRISDFHGGPPSLVLAAR